MRQDIPSRGKVPKAKRISILFYPRRSSKKWSKLLLKVTIPIPSKKEVSNMLIRPITCFACLRRSIASELQDCPYIFGEKTHPTMAIWIYHLAYVRHSNHDGTYRTPQIRHTAENNKRPTHLTSLIENIPLPCPNSNDVFSACRCENYLTPHPTTGGHWSVSCIPKSTSQWKLHFSSVGCTAARGPADVDIQYTRFKELGALGQRGRGEVIIRFSRYRTSGYKVSNLFERIFPVALTALGNTWVVAPLTPMVGVCCAYTVCRTSTAGPI